MDRGLPGRNVSRRRSATELTASPPRVAGAGAGRKPMGSAPVIPPGRRQAITATQLQAGELIDFTCGRRFQTWRSAMPSGFRTENSAQTRFTQSGAHIANPAEYPRSHLIKNKPAWHDRVRVGRYIAD